MIIALRGGKGSGKSTAAELIRSMCHQRSPVQVIGFADPIKEFCGHVYGFSDLALYGPSAERERVLPFGGEQADAAYRRAKSRIVIQFEMWGRALGRDLSPHIGAFWNWSASVCRHAAVNGDQITPRYVLQTFGTEFGRNVLGASFWIDLALARADHFQALHTQKIARSVIADCRFDNETIAVKQHRQGDLVIEIVNAEATPLPSSTTHASEQPCTEPPDFKIYNYPSRGLESLRQDIRRVTYL